MFGSGSGSSTVTAIVTATVVSRDVGSAFRSKVQRVIRSLAALVAKIAMAAASSCTNHAAPAKDEASSEPSATPVALSSSKSGVAASAHPGF